MSCSSGHDLQKKSEKRGIERRKLHRPSRSTVPRIENYDISTSKTVLPAALPSARRPNEFRFSACASGRSLARSPAARASRPAVPSWSSRVFSAFFHAIFQPLSLLLSKFHPTDFDHTSEKIKSQSGDRRPSFLWMCWLFVRCGGVVSSAGSGLPPATDRTCRRSPCRHSRVR